MRKVVIALLVAFALCTMSGCMNLNHTIGNGGGGEQAAKKRQWYFLWGLVPLGKPVDGGKLAEGSSDYTVKSSYTPVDFLLNIFTGLVTIQSQTVTVTK